MVLCMHTCSPCPCGYDPCFDSTLCRLLPNPLSFSFKMSVHLSRGDRLDNTILSTFKSLEKTCLYNTQAQLSGGHAQPIGIWSKCTSFFDLICIDIQPPAIVLRTMPQAKAAALQHQQFRADYAVHLVWHLGQSARFQVMREWL